MDARYIVLAVPFFVLAMAIEALLTYRRGTPTYRLHDTINNLSCGVGQQILGFLTMLIGLWVYDQVQTRAGLFEISLRSIPTWIAVFILDDFLYYAYHRASHRVNFLWATHAVHHQSEEYNLAAALRQSWFTSVTAFVFYLPEAILGVPMVMYLTIRTLNTLYQFWIHTRAIGTLGRAEWVLNTPSHHRVHHGIEPRYIDKNHAGVFIVWDRLLGTFTPEANEPVYGTVKPLASWNPLWANFVEFQRLWGMATATRRWRDKLLVWFMPPEWRPADLGGRVVIPEITRAQQHKYDVVAPPSVNLYASLSFVAVFVGSVLFLWATPELSWALRLVFTAHLVLGLVSVGALLESKRWAVPLETVRLLLLGGVALLLPQSYALGVLALALVSALGLMAARGKARGKSTAPSPSPQAISP